MSDASSPVRVESLPPTVQRSVSASSPTPVRMMAAKGLIPCSPRDLLSAILHLTYDPDPKVAETARGTAGNLPDKVLSSALRDDELLPEVLSFFGSVLAGNDTYLEFIVLNPATSDETIAEIASVASAAVVDVISQNQLRLLRDDRVVRGIVANPRTRPVRVTALLVTETVPTPVAEEGELE